MSEPQELPDAGYALPAAEGRVESSADARMPMNGLALASLILGIVSVVLAIVPIIDLLSVVTGVTAIVLGMLARQRIDTLTSRGTGFATAGLVLGIVAIALTMIVFVLLKLVLQNVGGAMVG